MKKRTFRSQIYYAEKIERVWRALTDPSELAQWLTKGDFKAKRGHKFTWKETDQATEQSKDSQQKDAPLENAICEIQEVEAPRRLVYRLEHTSDSASIVTWSLDTVGEGTQLIIEQELVVSSKTNTEPKLHPGVVSLAAYRRQRSMIRLQADFDVLLERLSLILKSQKNPHCTEAA